MDGTSGIPALIAKLEALQDSNLLTDQRLGEIVVMDMPAGRQLKDVTEILDRYRPHPRFLKAFPEFSEVASFTEYCKAYRGERGVIFFRTAEITADNDVGELAIPQAVALLDYHVDASQPRHLYHGAVLPLPYSEEWEAWSEDHEGLTQQGLAEFVEQHALDLVDPAKGSSAHVLAERLGYHLGTVAEVMAVSRDLQVNLGGQARSALRLTDGSHTVHFSQDTSDTSVKVPGLFAVQVPVFEAGRGFRYLLPIRLRFRMANGSVSWSLLPFRPADIARAAALELVDAMRKDTGLDVWLGRHGLVARR